MKARAEPRLARAATMVADPARSLMLAHLLGGDVRVPASWRVLPR
jgi:hypothetical protein